MYYVVIVSALAVFWLVLSGLLQPLLLTLGAASAILVTWLVRRMDRVDANRVMLFPGVRFGSYIAWLMWCVVKANIDLARRIWHPQLPIEPTWERLDTQVESPLEKTLYANSITLTPGTLTTDVRDDHFLIHSLTREALEELREGEMQRRVRRLGL